MAQWLKNESGGFLQVIVRQGSGETQLNMPSGAVENLEPGQELEVKITGDKLTVANGKNYVVREGRFQEAAGSTSVRQIVCQNCKRETPMSAQKCPHCGAWNQYVHPEIQRFLSNTDKVEVKSLLAWRFEHNQEEIAFTYDGILRPRFHMVKALGIGIGITVFGFIKWRNFFPESIKGFIYLLEMLVSIIGTLVLIYAGIGFLTWFWSVFAQAMSGKITPENHEKYLVINFATTPPQFQTNDERFWGGVLEFFSLRK